MKKILDGRILAQKLKGYITQEISSLNIKPGLAVIRVGNDPASEVYVRSKRKQAEELGISSWEYHFSETAKRQEIIEKIELLNATPQVHGILVQLPLPKHLSAFEVTNSVSFKKDVDGLHAMNSGKLFSGKPGLIPCTPLGILFLLRSLQLSLSGKHAVVIGRSQLVGKPIAQLLLQENCTITIAHSQTKNLETITQQADILIVAVGKPQLVKENWVKQGAIIIDVGINRLPDESLVGDVDYKSVFKKVSAITPVPGGVGPMTVACLLFNTLLAASYQDQFVLKKIAADPIKEQWCPL